MNIMRNCFTVCLAGLIIEIDTVSTCVCVLCRDYLQEGSPDLRIKITKDDVDREYNHCEFGRHNKVSAETTAAYHKIVDEALDFGIFLMHGAVVADEDNAYMFSAPSGTGKTTHVKLWLSKAENAVVVNGDKPLIRIIDDIVYVCGTPWAGSEGMNVNTVKPLKSIVFMERSEENHIEEISFLQAYPYLLQQTYIPSDAEKAKKTLDLISKLYGKVSFWRFQCNNFKDDCFSVAYNALVGKKP